MLFMLLVNLLFLLLLFIEHLFFVFCDIFEVQSFKVFYFHPPFSWSSMHTLMLIITVISQIKSLLQVSVFFWVILLFIERARNNTLFIIPLLCIVITRVLFRLLTTQFFINELSTLRSIVILLVIILSMTPLLYPLFLLLYRLQIYLLSRILFLALVF
jgi:hypothetical protein